MTASPAQVRSDFGGTLDNDGADWFTRLHELLNAHGGPIKTETFEQCTTRAIDAIELRTDTARLTMQEMAQRICEQLHCRLSEHNGHHTDRWTPAQVAETFMDQAQSCLQRNRAILAKLRHRFRLGVISNNWGNTAGWCAQFGLTQYLETTIDSTLIGAAKPDRKIFQAALDALQLPAESCAYVGDNFDCDVIGAHRAGLKPIWIKGTRQKPCPDEALEKQQIEKLSDLLEMDWD